MYLPGMQPSWCCTAYATKLASLCWKAQPVNVSLCHSLRINLAPMQEAMQAFHQNYHHLRCLRVPPVQDSRSDDTLLLEESIGSASEIAEKVGLVLCCKLLLRLGLLL